MSDPRDEQGLQRTTLGGMVPAVFAEKAMASLMQLHGELMEEKERRVELHRELMQKEQALAELKMYVKLLEQRLGRPASGTPVAARAPAAAAQASGRHPPAGVPGVGAQPQPPRTQPRSLPQANGTAQARPLASPSPARAPRPQAPPVDASRAHVVPKKQRPSALEAQAGAGEPGPKPRRAEGWKAW